jgi:uncharacterized protein (DUF1330 family)
MLPGDIISTLLSCKTATAFSRRNKEIQMSKGYWVTAYRKTNDPSKLAAYAQLAAPALAAAGGKFIVRGVAAEAREQGLQERTVVIEFPTYEQAVAAYESDAYKKALEALGDGVERDLRIIRGAE